MTETLLTRDLPETDWESLTPHEHCSDCLTGSCWCPDTPTGDA